MLNPTRSTPRSDVRTVPLDLRHWPKSPEPALTPTNWALAFLFCSTILALPALVYDGAAEPTLPVPLEAALARTFCPPANAPLEVVIKQGSVADNGTPRVACIYVTAGNGAVPKQRVIEARVAGVGQ
jgi:hypothetical protein